VVVHAGRDRVPPEVIGMLKPVMGDDEVRLYETGNLELETGK
jgi:hypothetical protein